MSKIRYSVLKNDYALTTTTTSGTETIDLPERGILSELVLLVRFAGTYTDNTILPRFHALTKVEVLVNGSTVVKSLDGRQIRALMWYNGGPFGVAENYNAAGNSNKGYDMFVIYFGKHANDSTCGLRLDSYANPQLRIQWDCATTSHDGISYDVSTTPAFVYSVIAKIMDEAPSVFTDRYVQSRQIDSYTVAASSEHNTEIPRGYPLKGIMLGGRYTSVAWYEFFDRVKLDFDNGKWLPIDLEYEQIAAAMRCWFPHECEWGAWIDNANGDDFDTRVMGVHGLGFASGSSSIGMICWEVFEFPLYTIGKYDPSGNASAIKTVMQIQVRGWGPHQTIYLPMPQLLNGVADSIQTTDYGRIDCKVTTGSGSGTSAQNKVCAEYLIPNGQ